METTDIHALGDALFNAKDDPSKLLEFSRLAHSSDATWNDLFDGLRVSGLVSEHAAIRLHVPLKVPKQLDRIVKSVDFWELYLETVGIEKSDRIRPF